MSRISMGIGLTNACNLACGHCYRPRGGVHYLDAGHVSAVLDGFEVHSVNLGTGENILNPHLPDVLRLLRERGVRTSLTSNGLTLGTLDAELLRELHDVEVSFDFATREELDAFRGEGVWDSAVAAVERCVDLGLDVTILAVMMRSNHDRLADVARLAARLGARFRVNVYQPTYDLALMPTWSELWEGFRRLFAETALITCTEPVVSAVVARQLGDPDRSRASGCGRTSVRLTPDQQLLPCVYWPTPAGDLETLAEGGGASILASPQFADNQRVPAVCEPCPLVAICQGGCASRRALTGGVDGRDPYCPFVGPDGEEVALEVRLGDAVELLHAANVCTTIVEADA